ncbi:MAG: hypothetical protein A3D24_02815 [Candidatus Blackburnbacteria bacterium RIFCSPHIGHO2_02_FULL_39_13]|uniref:Transcription regulator AsnC/Lrp ligand binding domain-containing protein n=1 Tax=Candidatus Blackburnbacteria bacterium RIFCSPLOWO2_01_FULL_40_20 TaxID=1797519 RepID=A0A1G1VBH6_9BACT|nr:MAG: hypothetical protein A2694_01720 [Candidatus Blackburnbacteria bacterium RIFCSPHIGHO2_01_FULL_40_17]OGY07755.1 MAG: hypothetical protein A3D24_02815 [Candidatus Blackburnbacteria bacterium RIFCSPHIGHO2_02_FULL_39_13]OGY12814.1 MAG: hypothetical protein A3A77_02980 [Candidatus Blackburnbacteria bacterium RIFCSPLOWO2_01_FULL_40_20]
MPGCHCGTRLRRRLRNRNLRNGWAKSLLELKKEKDAVKAFVLVRTENANHLRLDRWIRQNPTVQKIHRTRGYYQFVVETKYSDQREFEKWVLNLLVDNPGTTWARIAQVENVWTRKSGSRQDLLQEAKRARVGVEDSLPI